METLSRRAPGGVFRLPWGGACVSDTALAHKVLHDRAFNDGGSGFFGTVLPSRAAQIDLGRAVRRVLRSRMGEFRQQLVSAVAELPVASRWPMTGNELAFRSTADLMLRHNSSPALLRLMGRSARAGLIRPPRIRQRAWAEVLSARLFEAVTEQVRARRETSAGEPEDVLDAIIHACPSDIADRRVADLYVLMFRSIVGTVAYSVAWSLLLGGLHRPGAEWPWSAEWVVREAMRHRPVVWMVGRPVPHAAEFGGIAFESGDMLSVSPYLLHHDASQWTEPGVFRPERWGDPDGRGLYLPYSAGPFTCAGAAVAHTLVTETVAAIADGARLRVTGGDLRPIVTNAAAPRPFTLYRERR
ncbi:cytochrome P450 [Nocardia sp. NPDC052566]|uniref:cytochrome P450 n=1 Tax=Nocardia sp. NPDC052566 TaxID=3364330 RepID=UPI0037CC6B7F